jgi:hypothetical protein
MGAVSAVAHAGGMNEPVAEGPVVVVVTPPITTEPVHAGGYGSGTDDSPDTAVLPRADECAPDCGADVVGDYRIDLDSDGDESARTYSVSQAPDGRVLCFTVAADRRGAAGPFDLCMP